MRVPTSGRSSASRRSRYVLACLLAGAFPLTALAATDNWINAAGGAFFTGSNWNSNPNVPGNTDTAAFNFNGTYTVQFNSGPTNTSFLMQQGNVTWVATNAAQTYTVTGSPLDTGGTLTLGAASGPALTVAITGGLTVTGTSSPILAVTNNSILNTGNIDLGDNGASGFTGTINDSATITQSGSSTLTIGAALQSTGTLNITAGTFTTGTGLTSINAKGKINLNGGTFNANGNITVTGGSLTQTAGTFVWAGSRTMTIQSGGSVSLLGLYTTPANAVISVTGAGSQLNTTGASADLNIFNGASLSVTNGGSVHSDEAFDIASVGNGTVTVDGANSTLTAAAPATAAQNGLGYVGTGTLTFSTGATGSVPAGFIIGALNTSSGTLNVQSNATLTTGRLDLADQGNASVIATALVNVTGGTLTQSGTAPLIVGEAAGGSATVIVGIGGVYNTGTGITAIGATGQVNVNGGTLNANGNITVAGGLLNQASGTFNWASSKTMTIQTGGDVRLADAYNTPGSATINVTGIGAQLNDIGSSTADLQISTGATLSVTGGGSVHSDQFLDIAALGNGTVTVDGSGSSFSAAEADFENFLGISGTGSLTLSTSATGSAPGGFEIGGAAGSSGSLYVQSSAVLTSGRLDIADQGNSATGFVNVTGGTLTQSDASTLVVGQVAASGGVAVVSVGTGGTFTTGTGTTTIGATGQINLTGGTFNLNGGLTVTGGSFTQTAGTFTWAASQTMTIQSAGNVTLIGSYTTPTNANITITGNSSILSDTGPIARLTIDNGTAVSVTAGGSLHSDQFLNIGQSGNATVTVDGANSSLSSGTAQSILGNAGNGSLTFSNSSTGNIGFLQIGSQAGSTGTLNVQSSATVTLGSLSIAPNAATASGIVNVIGGTITQTGASALTVGAASASAATMNLGNATTAGNFTTGTGNTSINATGKINLTGGAFTANGNITVTGGSFTQTGGTFTWAGSKTMTIQSGGMVTLAGLYLTPTNAVINISGNGSTLENTGTNAIRVVNGATVSVTSGGTLKGDNFLNIGFGTVTIDGSGSSFSTAAPVSSGENVIGNSGNSSTVTFSNQATGSVTSGFLLGLTDGSSGTLNVQSSATLTSGPLDVADAGVPVTGVVNVVGGTLTQSGSSYLAVGQPAGGTATVNIGNATTGAIFTTGTGLTTINATGKLNLNEGTFNLNGGLTVTGGAFTQTGGLFTWAASQTMTIQSGGNVSLPGAFFTPTSATINVTGLNSELNNTGSSAELGIVSGSTLSVTSGGTVNCNKYLLIDQGTVTVDGVGSSLTASAPVGSGQTLLGIGGTGSLTFSNSAIGSVGNGFLLGLNSGSSGTLNVQSNATLSTGPLDIADQGNASTGVINVTGGTLIQSGNSTLTVGQPAASGGTATLTIGLFGTFATGSGPITIGTTGTVIDQSGGNFLISGNVTNAGNLTFSGNYSSAPNTTLTNTAGKTTFTSNGKLYGLSITGGTVDTTAAKLIIEPTNKSTALAALQADLANGSLTSFALPAGDGLAIVDNAITHFFTFGGNPADINSILVGPELLGDANVDGHVDLNDLNTVLNHLGTSTRNWTDGNFDHAATIDLNDLNDVLNHLGTSNPSPNEVATAESLVATQNVPEPASLALLLAAVPLVAAKSRRRKALSLNQSKLLNNTKN